MKRFAIFFALFMALPTVVFSFWDIVFGFIDFWRDHHLPGWLLLMLCAIPLAAWYAWLWSPGRLEARLATRGGGRQKKS